jgi:LPS-assembly protein
MTTGRPWRLLATALPLVLASMASPVIARPIADDPAADAAAATTGATAPGDITRADVPPALTVADPGAPLANNQVAFTANTIDYDYKTQIVVASGDVRMLRQGSRLRADTVTWDRKANVAHAHGNVAIENPQGDISYADDADLTDDLKNGVADNLLLVLENGGRMASVKGKRTNGVYDLDHATYSPCDVTTDTGCPKQPLWEITADHVTYDPARHRVSYKDARLRLLGVPFFFLPIFSHPDGTGAGGNSGALVPDATYNSRNGLEVATPYYWQIAPNKDLTVTPHVFTAVAPMAEAQYRALDGHGAFQIHGYATYSSQSLTENNFDKRFRGYIDANGRFQFGPAWTITTSIRQVTDKTFLRRYDIAYDDRLRSVVQAERIDDDSYLSIAGWQFRTLVLDQHQKNQPIALPLIDYRRRIADPLLDGTITLQANTLAISRIQGQDTQRAFAGAQWQKWLLTPLGQMIGFTGYLRGDLYHTSDTAENSIASYRGDPGFETRGVAAIAAEMRWPFVGAAFGGTQIITPRIQLVASPHAKNMAIPDEDARAIDLDDSNLFALNRFNGYDRWEGDRRVTYGLDYSLDLPHFALRTNIGQSYRFGGSSNLFPNGTGLSGAFSDYVGRTTLRYGSFVSLTHSFRLDKDSLSFRRNEIDATLGSQKTYILIGYLDLNRHISPTVEDLQDHQEIRFGGRLAFLKRWSLFGSATVDLTNSKDESNFLSSTGSGFDPVQSRLGLAYEDDCFKVSVQWRRDFAAFGDAVRGSTIQFQLAFKNLGR